MRGPRETASNKDSRSPIIAITNDESFFCQTVPLRTWAFDGQRMPNIDHGFMTFPQQVSQEVLAYEQTQHDCLWAGRYSLPNVKRFPDLATESRTDYER